MGWIQCAHSVALPRYSHSINRSIMHTSCQKFVIKKLLICLIINRAAKRSVGAKMRLENSLKSLNSPQKCFKFCKSRPFFCKSRRASATKISISQIATLWNSRSVNCDNAAIASIAERKSTTDVNFSTLRTPGALAHFIRLAFVHFLALS